MTLPRESIVEKYGQQLRHAACGNEAAFQYLVSFICVLHAWDDLIDKDRPVADADIHEAFLEALINIPRNPFYRNHQDRLCDVTENSVLQWLTANVWERADQIDGIEAQVAFIIRSNYVEAVTTVALICGGMQHAIDINLTLRPLAHWEGVGRYLENLQTEKEARDNVL